MRGGHWELSPRGSPYSCSVGPGRSLKTRGHADGEKRRLSKLRGKQEGMPRRKSSGKGPRGRQKAELGLQWEGAGEGGTSRGGGASGLRADGGRFALLSRTLQPVRLGRAWWGWKAITLTAFPLASSLFLLPWGSSLVLAPLRQQRPWGLCCVF